MCPEWRELRESVESGRELLADGTCPWDAETNIERSLHCGKRQETSCLVLKEK